jgi:hypothetical protein
LISVRFQVLRGGFPVRNQREHGTLIGVVVKVFK